MTQRLSQGGPMSKLGGPGPTLALWWLRHWEESLINVSIGF